MADTMKEQGEDSEGNAFKSIDEMWTEQLKEGHDSWYKRAQDYWDNQEASVNGVLGGYGDTSTADIRESTRFLELLQKGDLCNGNKFETALDTGAGIGRVTQGLLKHKFRYVDLMEPCEKMLNEAKRTIELRNTYSTPLQDFTPEGPYDCIWNQWCLLYLTDDHLVDYLKRCKSALRENGIIVVKENVVVDPDSGFLVDKEDNSITRKDSQYKDIFTRAGLKVIMELRQACWPKDLLPVMMYMLRP